MPATPCLYCGIGYPELPGGQWAVVAVSRYEPEGIGRLFGAGAALVVNVCWTIGAAERSSGLQVLGSTVGGEQAASPPAPSDAFIAAWLPEVPQPQASEEPRKTSTRIDWLKVGRIETVRNMVRERELQPIHRAGDPVGSVLDGKVQSGVRESSRRRRTFRHEQTRSPAPSVAHVDSWPSPDFRVLRWASFLLERRQCFELRS